MNREELLQALRDRAPTYDWQHCLKSWSLGERAIIASTHLFWIRVILQDGSPSFMLRIIEKETENKIYTDVRDDLDTLFDQFEEWLKVLVSNLEDLGSGFFVYTSRAEFGDWLVEEIKKI